MVEPELMCNKHLLGEHLECHMFVGTINKGTSVKGYLKKNLLEPRSIKKRHDALADEMLRRDFNHWTPLEEVDITGIDDVLIDRAASRAELLRRCEVCGRSK